MHNSSQPTSAAAAAQSNFVFSQEFPLTPSSHVSLALTQQNQRYRTRLRVQQEYNYIVMHDDSPAASRQFSQSLQPLELACFIGSDYIVEKIATLRDQYQRENNVLLQKCHPAYDDMYWCIYASDQTRNDDTFINEQVYGKLGIECIGSVLLASKNCFA